MFEISKISNQIIGWWSGGVTSAVAIWLAIKMFGIDRVRIVMIDTGNEDDDTYRFKYDCEKWYGKEIEVIRNPAYESILDVWYKYLSLNVATGAICSSELKRAMRIDFMRNNSFSAQIFGFDIDEPKRAKAMTLNYSDTNPIYPLLMFGYTKKKCIKILNDAGIKIPRMYEWGFNNNNCAKMGCVQGGIGYWQKMLRDRPEVFYAMANVEHDLTRLKGEPVTCLRNQTKKRKGEPIFLLPHPDYLQYEDISMKTGKEPELLVECNGFCGTYDLVKSSLIVG